MDPRKQKRLGPAPIASFEKSFEDTTSATLAQHIGVAAVRTTGSTNHANPVEQDNMQRKDQEVMEPQQKKTVAAATKTITTTTTNNSKDPLQQHHQQQQQQQQPGISISAAAADAAGSSKPKHDGNTKRPPPLKTATASAVTTLVSSGEAQLVTFKGATTLTTPSTPRIELSRASSSSHHDEEDSRESSPENVFEQVGTGTLQETIGVGFREEGTLELRSSTEELYFMDPEQKKEEQEKIQQQAKRSSPHIFKFDEHQNYLQQHQRKDSASSEVAALLCISGRTSRISSVGSQGSAVSRLSAVSDISRSPSPHRMLLETSFCGPKPLENLVDARGSATSTERPTVELLEQVLLARKHDPTQAVLAEGIKVESSPKRKPTSLANGDAKLAAKIASQNRPSVSSDTLKTTKTLTMGAQRRSTKSPGQMVIGKTPGGTEYIRINLKPDHMYDDKGIALNERVVEAPNSLAPVYAVKSQKKPASLSLGRNVMDETRLTPTASPKPTRHSTLSKEGTSATHGSRSPSPATISVSRKSSFSSLFRLGGKDSPDSPRERSRSRSKSKERQTPQSQNVTPSKQKSVLAIFKPGKRGSSAGTDPKSSSKSSSPIDAHELQQHHRSKTNTPLLTATGSRPNSRLRYYDEPVEGVIHIPLHTPPEEKETRKLLQGIQQLNAEPKPIAAPITASQLAAAAAALKPVGTRTDSVGSTGGPAAFIPPPPPPRPQQIEKLQRIENLDAIQTLSQDDENKERTWSLEVNRHSSQDSQETVGSEGSYASAIKLSDIRAARSKLTHVKEHVVQEIGVPVTASASAEIHRLPSVESTMSVCEPRIVETVATVNAHEEDAVAKERRRLLFATRLGSGSQEQIFSTQFSISKTESLSSQLSEQIPETIIENSPPSANAEHLQRQITVIRREEEDDTDLAATTTPLKRHGSIEATAAAASPHTKSVSTSEDEKPVLVAMRRNKDSNDESFRKSRATSDEDADATAAAAITGGGSIRHSRYLENFDVRKKYHENVPRKPKRQSISEGTTKLEDQVAATAGATSNTTTICQEQRKPTLPQPPPPSTAPSPSPPPLQSSARASRTPTPPTKPTPRSQSQSPVERSGSSSRQTPTKPPRTSTPTRRSSSTQATPTTPPLIARPPQTPSPPAIAGLSTPLKHPPKKQPQISADRQSVHSTDEPIESSESERDSDLAAGGGLSTAITVTDPKRRHLPRHVGVIEDHESTGLVSQESFDDELPYIPTTLPEERAQGVALIPMKERANMELKTCPVDRPRSTTPLNPSHLEEFGVAASQDSAAAAAIKSAAAHELSGSLPVRGEKLRISLPRKDSTKEKPQSSQSPRRTSNTSGKSWFEFAEEGLRAGTANLERKDSNKQLLPAQVVEEPTPSKTKGSATTSSSKAITKTVHTTQVTPTTASTSTQRKLSGHWIDFENIPEKRKPPKRITTLPRETTSSRNHPVATKTTAAPTVGHHQYHHNGSQQQTPQPDVTSSSVQVGNSNSAASSDGKMHYNYVKPEDCQCECHEVERGGDGSPGAVGTGCGDAGDDGSNNANKSITSVDLLQQGEDMLPLLDPDTHDGIEPSDSSREYSCYTDDEMDVPMRHSGSSRSKSSSSKLDEFPRRDVAHSPRSKKFPDNRM